MNIIVGIVAILAISLPITFGSHWLLLKKFGKEVSSTLTLMLGMCLLLGCIAMSALQLPISEEAFGLVVIGSVSIGLLGLGLETRRILILLSQQTAKTVYPQKPLQRL
ncbi:MAG: hypothetical protein WCO60_07100 [Verrucomicrobiota bacterium]